METGALSSSKERCYGLKNEEPMQCPVESKDDTLGMNEFPIFKRMERLPFGRLLTQRR